MSSRKPLVIVLALVTLLVACSKREEARRYTLQGQVTAVSPTTSEATIKHEAIAGFMPAMTMAYKFRNKGELDALRPGDLLTASLVVLANDAYLEQARKVGEAPLEAVPTEAKDVSPAAASGFELLKAGDPVPATAFVDQAGKAATFERMRGSVVVLTFTYTRCPMPTFCPLMDRHFSAIQKSVKADPALNGRVRLATVSFDPETDTPAVLTKHAEALGADPAMWSFFTGDRDDIDQFAGRFGVSVMRGNTPQAEITHNLRTAVIDRNGALVKVYTGNDWAPAQIVSDLKALAAR